MNKLYIVILMLAFLLGCNNKKNNEVKETDANNADREMIVDSLLYFRHHAKKTDILSRRHPDLSREQAVAIQLAILKKELDEGAQQVGWKMGGAVTDDSTKYDPVFGYILDSNLIQEDSTVLSENFPGGEVMIEGEIGFVMKKDFKNGVGSLKELKEGIDYVINAVEFAQATSIPFHGNPETMSTNHVLAAGMGQAGTLIGPGKAKIEHLNMKAETVKCFIDGILAAEGIATNVYGTPIHALYSLANMLPEYGLYLKKGDIIITGSLYDNPTIKSTCDVRLDYSTLGSIHFSMK